MTLNELITTVERVITEDQGSPEVFKPLVAIGHTKDLVDFETVESFLSYLKKKNITISTFEHIHRNYCPDFSTAVTNAGPRCIV